MSIDIIIRKTKKIESLLVRIGAEGRGLHEKVTSIEGKLEPQVIKRIRFIASIRNKSLHDYNFELTEDVLSNFIDASDEVDVYLSSIIDPHSTPNTSSSSSSGSSKGLLDTFSDASTLGKVGIVAAAIVAVVLSNS